MVQNELAMFTLNLLGKCYSVSNENVFSAHYWGLEEINFIYTEPYGEI